VVNNRSLCITRAWKELPHGTTQLKLTAEITDLDCSTRLQAAIFTPTTA